MRGAGDALEADAMTYTVASFSGGKDSTAMVLRMMELGEDLDEVIFCDTGMEFPAMYDHIMKVRKAVESEGVKFTVLEPEHSFEWLMLEKPIESKKYGHYSGQSWPSMHVRWCTRYLKAEVSDRHLTDLRERYGEVTLCTGLAADEGRRIERRTNAGHRHPLAEWGWTEDMCLGYCYGRGYDWHDPSVGKGLYEIFSRTSCWICPLGTIDNFRQLRRWYPELWAKIGDMEVRLRERRESESLDNVANAWKYTPRNSWQDLEDRFAREDLGIMSVTTLEDFS
jgi:3'-phosphoadenosine 5'-phosphosulfate sulfotransferase (PAPS reductase)/FAD synthetase